MKIVIVSIILGLLMGCAGSIKTDHLLLTNTSLVPLADGQQTEILFGPPTRAHTKIAMIEAKQWAGFVQWAELKTPLIEEARKLGADAIIDLKMGGEPYGAFIGTGASVGPTAIGSSGQLKVLTGTAIKFQE